MPDDDWTPPPPDPTDPSWQEGRIDFRFINALPKGLSGADSEAIVDADLEAVKAHKELS